MNDRRTLLEGMKPPASSTPSPLTAEERRFAYGEQPEPRNESRTLLSTRIRSDFAKALKRASLQRQLEGVTPNTLQDILEEAIEPWLRTHGFIP